MEKYTFKDFIFYLAEKNLYGIRLDLFYLISLSKEHGITKFEIRKEYAKLAHQENIGNPKEQRFRTIINEALATLEGMSFIENMGSTHPKYFLGDTGTEFLLYIEEFLHRYPKAFRGSLIVTPLYKQADGQMEEFDDLELGNLE